MNWDILLKYLNKECTDAEGLQVTNWLNEQKENRLLLSYLEKRQEQLNQPLKKEDIHAQWVLLLDRIFETKQQTHKDKNNNGFWLMGMAASLMLFSLLGWFHLSNRNEPAAKLVTLQTPIDNKGQLTLPDGSKVYMAPGSKLTYTTAFGTHKREVHLTGEAFFNVKHITAKPFVVHAENKLDLTVLGTSFNVYSRKGCNTEIKVATGLVGVTANKHTSFLKAGQQLIYQLAGAKLTLAPVVHNDAAALENQTLFFNDDDANGVAEKLHRWYNINVEVLPTAAKHHRFSGEMKDTGLNTLLQGLHYATGLKYRFTQTHTIQLY